MTDKPDITPLAARRFPEQVGRLLIAFTLVIGGALTVRAFLPAKFKQVAANQALAAQREAARPVKYAGSLACGTCHGDVADEKVAGRHRNLSCETCHGPAAAHLADPTATTPTVPRERNFCQACHAYDPSRPTGFPQIHPSSHNPLQACIECHKPHAPEPPTTPKECSACHEEISRMKALSPHAALECTTCHLMPTGHELDEHRNKPRSILPTKPSAREFCGKCHGQGVADATAPKAAPRIDLAEHEPKYMCWDCHHPHSPGGK